MIGDVDRVGSVVGNDFALVDLGERMALLAPFQRDLVAGGQDRLGAGDVAGLDAVIGRVLRDVGVRTGRDDACIGEGELRPGVDGDLDRHVAACGWRLAADNDVVDRHAVDGDVDGAAIAPVRIERGDQALAVGNGAGIERVDTGRRLVRAGNEIGRFFKALLELLVLLRQRQFGL